jgi:hypothetical protein
MARWKLQARPNKDGTWRLNIPGSISSTGKRQRLYFEKQWQALAAANNLRKHHDQFGFSARMLSPSQSIEAKECWDLLGGDDAPPGSMRKIILKAVQAQKESEASITLDELFNQYAERMKRIGRSRNYLAQIGYARKVFDFGRTRNFQPSRQEIFSSLRRSFRQAHETLTWQSFALS